MRKSLSKSDTVDELVTPADNVTSLRQDGTRTRWPEQGFRLGRYFLLDNGVEANDSVRIYTSYDTGLGRRAQLQLRARHLEHLDAEAMLQEARVLAQVSHPNVTPVYDVGEWPNGVFMATENIVGCTMEEWVQTQAPSRDRKLRLLADLGRAIDAFHERGLAHGQIRASNILVRENDACSLQGQLGASQSLDLDGTELEFLNRSLSGRSSGPATLKANPQRADLCAYLIFAHTLQFGLPPFPDLPLQRRVRRLMRDRIESPANLHRNDRKFFQILSWALIPPQYGGPLRLEEISQKLESLLPRKSRFSAYALGLTTVSMLFALASESTASPSAISPHCMERENPITSSWTSHRPSVEKYFADAPVSYARAAFARLQESFDRYAERWQNAQRSVCRGDHRSLVFDAQVRCLEDVHQSSQSLMHILSNVRPQDMGAAPDLVGQLPAPEKCKNQDLDVLRASVFRPETPRQAELYQRAQTSAQKLWVYHSDELELELRETLHELQQENMQLVEAELRLRWAESRQLAPARELNSVLENFRRAFEIAKIHSRSDLAARSLLAQAFLRGYVYRNPELGYELLHEAESHMIAIGSPAELRASMLRFRAIMATATKNHEESVHYFRKRIALIQAQQPISYPALSGAILDLGIAFSESGDLSSAVTYYSQAAQIAERHLPNYHPEAIFIVSSWYHLALMTSNIEPARRHRATMKLACESGLTYCSVTRLREVTIAAELGESQRSFGLAQELLDQQVRQGNTLHPYLPWMHVPVAALLLERGYSQQALDLWEQGAIHREDFPHVHAELANELDEHIQTVILLRNDMSVEPVTVPESDFSVTYDLNPEVPGRALSIANQLIDERRHTEALTWIEAFEAWQREHGDFAMPRQRAKLLLLRAHAHARLGQWTKAEEFAQQGQLRLDSAAQMNHPSSVGHRLLRRQLAAHRGDLSLAKQLDSEIQALIETHQLGPDFQKAFERVRNTTGCCDESWL